MRPSVVVVVPTIREIHIKRFLDAWIPIWSSQLEYDFQIVIVEDHESQEFDLRLHDAEIHHYSWKDIKFDLGSLEWIIPRRSDTVRSYGYYKAYQLRPDFIVTLDDDCLPYYGQDVVLGHIRNLTSVHNEPAWYNTLEGKKPRGLPYFSRERQNRTRPVLSHGLWDNSLDFDAPTRLVEGNDCACSIQHIANNVIVPKGFYYPMSGMNLGWRTEITPIMYFLLQGSIVLDCGQLMDLPFDRMGDIWCGIIAKKILDYLGQSVYTGRPYIHHNCASNVFVNLQREAKGLEVNECLWKQIDEINLTQSDYIGCYREIAHSIGFNDQYWNKLREAMVCWSELF